jgi:hypothetical protein
MMRSACEISDSRSLVLPDSELRLPLTYLYCAWDGRSARGLCSAAR